MSYSGGVPEPGKAGLREFSPSRRGNGTRKPSARAPTPATISAANTRTAILRVVMVIYSPPPLFHLYTCLLRKAYEGRRPAVMRQCPELAGKNVPILPSDLKSLRLLLQALSLPLVAVAGRRCQYPERDRRANGTKPGPIPLVVTSTRL